MRASGGDPREWRPSFGSQSPRLGRYHPDASAKEHGNAEDMTLQSETETPLPVLDLDELERRVERLHAEHVGALGRRDADDIPPVTEDMLRRASARSLGQ